MIATTTEVPVRHRSAEQEGLMRLAIQLEDRLQRITGRTLRVHICGNEVQVFGEASSWHDKQLVQESARSLAPSLRIRNELRVDAPGR